MPTTLNGVTVPPAPATYAAQVHAWAAQGESETQDFKETTGQRSEGCRSLCGFLNLRGGRVLFGVDKDGVVRGQEVTDKTLEKIYREIAEIDPECSPSVERVEVAPGREVVVLSAAQGRYRPYRYKGRAYKRVGTVTTEMGRDAYEQLFLETSHSAQRWEIEPATLALEDLDEQEIVRTLDDAVRRGRISDPLSRAPLDVLRGFGLVKGEQVLNAAVVLFGRRDRLLPGYTQCMLKLAHFDGRDKGDRLLNERQEHGNAFWLLRTAEEFMRQGLSIRTELTLGSMVREDDPEIPILALREALANAISHREYAVGSGSIAVNIYSDRLEVTSVGPLHFGLSVADLYRPHESQPWNPLVAGTLYRRGVIDSLGSGTLRMVRACQEAGLFSPEIQDTGTSVRVDFPRAGALPTKFHGTPLSVHAREVLLCITSRGPLALRELVAELPNLDERDVREELQRLRQAGAIKPEGVGRGARWALAAPVG